MSVMDTDLPDLTFDADFHLFGAESALLSALRALEQSPDVDPDNSKRAALKQAMEAIRGAA